MALTSAGLDIPTLQEIKTDLATKLQTELGIPLDTSENAVAGVINSIYAAAISNAYELLETVYTQRTLEGAEGVNLDDLVSYTNTYRDKAQPSRSSKVHFSGQDGTNIPQNAVVTNPATLDRYLVESPVTISTSACYKVVFSVGTVLNNTDYPISVNGSEFTYTSDADATEDEILTGIETAFASSAGYTVTKVGSTLEIVSNFIDVVLVVTATTFLNIESVTSVGTLVSEEEGAIVGPIGSLTRISSPTSGWEEVTNPEAVILGRDRESDEELYERQQTSLAISKAGTPDAIASALRSLSGVTTAFVIENATSFIDTDFRPPSSYESVVAGGTSADIAQLLWDSKPAGIELVGNIVENATDIDGFSQQVKFSRPQDAYIHVEVTYTIYDEESFPATGEDSIKEAVLATAANLTVGNDVIPKRFYGRIYETVAGIEDLTVGMARTANPGDTPAGYSEDVIEIGLKELADFSLDRITVVGP